jgi:ABC-type glutathione transport system ATPase component
MSAPLIQTRDLVKVYRIGSDKDHAEGRGSEIRALAGVSVDIAQGEFVAVMGHRAPSSPRS